MNRYIITVLYVVAGCAVSVPLHEQPGKELFRGDHFRIVVTYERTIAVEHVSKETQKQKFYSRCDDESVDFLITGHRESLFEYPFVFRQMVALIDNPIRAPELIVA